MLVTILASVRFWGSHDVSGGLGVYIVTCLIMRRLDALSKVSLTPISLCFSTTELILGYLIFLHE